MPTPHHDNHKAAWDRRFFYGGNVAAMIFGVLVILVFANWLAQRSGLRIDRTATRMYSLSDQTRRVLGRLDREVAITTVLGVSGAVDEQAALNMQHFRDLLDEYERRGGGKVEVTHIDAGDFRAFDRFALKVTEAYADELDAARQTVEASLDALDQMAVYGKAQSPRFAAAAARFGDRSPGLKDQLQTLAGQFEQMGESESYRVLRRRTMELLDEPLSDHADTLNAIRQITSEIHEGSVRHLVALYQREAEADDNPPELRTFFAESLAQTRPLEQRFEAVLARYEGVDLSDYDTIRTNLQSSDSAVVMAGGKLTAVALRDVYMQVVDTDADEPVVEQRFRGEEAVTGAIVGLTTQTRTKVVFVDAIGNALGQGTGCDHLKQRLRNIGMEVVDWNPAPAGRPGGPAPRPRPVAEEGQALVWVFLRPPPLNPTSPGGLAALRINEAFKRTVEGADPVLVMATTSQMAQFGQPDPVAEQLLALGVKAETDRAVYAEVLDREGNPGESFGHQVIVRDADHPIGAAINGQLVLSVGLPLDAAGDDASFWPLVNTDRQTWADSPFGAVERDPGDPAGPFTVAAAAQVGGRRAVVLSDLALDVRSPMPSMYSDLRLVERFAVLTPEGLRDDERMRLPGNAELFLNSVYWLAGRDELIATSARSQDVRRIGDISPSARTTVGWLLLAGLPLACIGLGLGVGLVRRK